jgi:hypothetical protein
VNLSSGQLALQNDLVAPPAPIQTASINNFGNFNITGTATGIIGTAGAVFNNNSNARHRHGNPEHYQRGAELHAEYRFRQPIARHPHEW